MCRVLSVLIAINVQAKSDINLGGQGIVITIKGWLSNRVFMQAKHMQFCKNRPIGCVYKTRTKHASKDGIELAVFEAFGEILVEALSFGLGIAKLVLVHGLAALLVNGLSFVHTVVYDTHKQTHNQEKGNKSFIVELESEMIKIRSSE